MVFSFESWRFLYLFFYKFYLNTTVENMSILWIDLTNNKGTSLVTFNWKSMSHLAPLSSLTTSPLSPPTPESNVWSSDDTWHVASPPLRLQTTHTLRSEASSSLLDFLNPLRLPSAPWLMHDVLIRASLGNFQLMSGLHEYSRQIWFSIPATSLLTGPLLLARSGQVLGCSEKWDDGTKNSSRGKQLSWIIPGQGEMFAGFSSPSSGPRRVCSGSQVVFSRGRGNVSALLMDIRTS